MDANDVVGFWRDAGEASWFRKDEEFDRRFRDRFLSAHYDAAARKLDAWSTTAEGALALLILLDQFPRNSFRQTAHMFATDPLARFFATRAVASKFDLAVDAKLRPFFYLPFMHSENLADQDRSIELTAPLGEEVSKFARMHRDIIARFGRFAHRNAALGRETTPEEKAFLDSGGFAG